MKEIDFKTLNQKDIYRFLLSAVVPRPIAFVSTMSTEGVNNLAPFSFYNAVASAPPTVMFSISKRSGGALNGQNKDTLDNILSTKEFVVNASTEELLHQINKAAHDYAPGESEFEATALTAVPSKCVSAPRVKEAAFSMECRLMKIVEIGDQSVPGSTVVVFGEIIWVAVQEELLETSRLKIDPKKLHPLSRLGGIEYGTLGKLIELKRL
jgi:flavin reductase (DIM6/NTAB) family NADH-FMN oxidoreductase RutF